MIIEVLIGQGHHVEAIGVQHMGDRQSATTPSDRTCPDVG